MRFFLQSLKRQKDALLYKVERENLLVRMSPVAERLVVLARERGRVTISDAVELLGLNRNTAKLHFRQLVQEGHLLQHGSGRGTWYSVGR